MRVELHCHSTCSDGSDPPHVVAERAARDDVALFCLTDHDTCAGYPATLAISGRGGIRVLRGVELSCVEDGRTVHLLLYDAARDHGWDAVEQALTVQLHARRDRVHAIARALRAAGVVIDPDVVIAAADGNAVGRPHVARALVAAGAVRSLQEAFDRYLCDGGVADVPLSRLSVAAGLSLARQAGAVASLAHPHTLGNLAEPLVVRYRPAGLEGIEAGYARYTARERRRWTRVARAADLVITGGSDYHGALPEPAPMGVELTPDDSHKLLRWLRIS